MSLSRAWRQRAVAKTLIAGAYKSARNRVPHELWDQLRARVHPALRHKASVLTRAHTPNLGRLSVIVPCYGVEQYLRGCLSSLIRQSYPNLEIIVVIDGSPDRSAEIARGYARWDRRVRVIEQRNAGLGAARNTGIRHSTGDFLTFVDSDDDLPMNAYAKMMACLGESGSDFVVGSIRRRKGNRTWLPRWAEDVHRFTRSSLTLEDYPDVLADVFACNKIFRRDFFLDHVFPFPEGVRYEDQVPSARAYTAARSFDVLHDVVYSWYVRDDGTSLSQQKGNMADLRDRLSAIEQVAKVLETKGSPDIRSAWAAKTLGLDLGAYYRAVPRAGEDYWTSLREIVLALSKDLDPTVWERIDIHDRVLARLVMEDRREDVCTVVRRLEELGGGCVEVDRSVSPPIGRPLYLSDLDRELGDEQLRLSPGDNALRTTLVGYRVDSDDLEVTVAAWLPGSSSDPALETLTGRFVRGLRGDNRPSIDAQVERCLDEGFAEVAEEAAAAHAACGYRLRFPLQELVRAIAASPNTGDDGQGDIHDWHLELTLRRGSSSWTSRVRSRDHRWTANSLPASPVLSSGDRAILQFGPSLGLRVDIARPLILAQSAVLTGRALRLCLRVDGQTRVRSIVVENKYLGIRKRVSVEQDSAGALRATVPIPHLPRGANRNRNWIWTVTAQADEQSLPVHFSGSQTQLETSDALAQNLRLSVDGQGRLRCQENIRHAVVSAVDVEGDYSSFTVRGFASLPGRATPHVALAGTSAIWPPDHVDYDSRTGAFSARFSVVGETAGVTMARQPPDGWSLRLLSKPKSLKRSLWVPVAGTRIPDVENHYLAWFENQRSSFRFTITARARALWVNTRAPLGEAQGRYQQRELQLSIPNLLRSPLRDVVLFSSYNGKSASDSPVEIHKELRRRGTDFELVWAVADYTSEVPTDSRRVLVGSAEYYDRLHTSRFVVNNNNFPHYYRKHRDQVYLQTWHGTPLKRIGNDVPAGNLSLSYRSLMHREAAAWDYLLAQNDFASTILPAAFGFTGEVLTHGYPRNDPLTLENPVLAEAVRRRVGIRPGQRVVLYAPTWRDNARSASGRYAFVNHLGLSRVSTTFGTDAVLLVRGHSNTPGMDASTPKANIIDVSAYPNVTDLLSISDVLITDYSSIMFDFVVTGRPMLFLVPDLEQYSGTTRGLYLDFENIAPGPLHNTTDEILRSLADLDTVAAAFQARYVAFRDRFAPYDDGLAASRVVDAVWGGKSTM